LDFAQIAGAEKIGPNSVEIGDFADITTQHIQLLRQCPHLLDLPVFVAVENNNNQYVATAFSCAGRSIRHCRVLASCSATSAATWRFGVVTTESTKHAMIRNFMHLCTANQLKLSDHFFSSRGDPEMTKTAIQDQLKQFAFVSKEIRLQDFQSGNEEKARVHGKAGGKTDDLAFALLQACLYASMTAATPYYMRSFGMEALRLNHRLDPVIQEMTCSRPYSMVNPSEYRPSSATPAVVNSRKRKL
jgi:hypothetical protein